jgi:hypothetical protein
MQEAQTQDNNQDARAGTATTRREQITPASKNKTRSGKAKATAKQGKRGTPNPPGYASFNRERARGRFAELDADSSASEEADSDDDGDEEAPSAYGGDHPARPTELQVDDAASVGPAAAPQPPSTTPAHAIDVDSDCESTLSGYVGSSAPSQPEVYASTPGSEFPFSPATPPSDKMEQVEECPISDAAASGITSTVNDCASSVPIVGGSQGGECNTLSQDGFSLDRVAHPVGMPQQLPVFLGPFGGSLIAVPSNGQCAYAALYATTSYVEGQHLYTHDDQLSAGYRVWSAGPQV